MNFILKNLNKSFFKNLSYLAIVELSNVIIPFILLPYLLIVLGNKNYGLVIFAQSVILYLLLIQNFGLTTYGVREISLNSKNIKEIEKVVSSIFILKIFLFIINFFILYIVTIIFDLLRENRLLLFLSMWICFNDIIFPKWYFQGIEKMKSITVLALINKLVSLVLILLFINSKNDYLLVPIFYGIGSFISSIICLYVIFVKHNIKFIIPKISSLYNIIKQSLTFFISEVSVALFANSNKVIIGSYLGMIELSYYDVTEKIVSVFRNIPLTVVRDSIYPRVVKTKNFLILRKTTIVMGLYAIVSITIIFLFSNDILTLLGGNQLTESLLVLRIYSITIFTTHISNYYITVGLWATNHEKIFRNLMFYSAILFFFLFLLLLLVKKINIYTLTSLPIFVDIYLIIHTIYIYKEKRILNA